jgi:chromosome segregation ATPase
MNLDTIPDQIGQLVEYARVALAQEITGARNAVDSLNGEKAAAANALTDLKDQHKQAQSQLDAVLSDLQRGSTLVGLNTEIKKARKELEQLKAETAEATTALEALKKQRSDASAKLAALQTEAQRQSAIRSEAESVYAAIKAKVFSVQLGQRP